MICLKAVISTDGQIAFPEMFYQMYITAAGMFVSLYAC